jgi:hypothetical protein
MSAWKGISSGITWNVGPEKSILSWFWGWKTSIEGGATSNLKSLKLIGVVASISVSISQSSISVLQYTKLEIALVGFIPRNEKSR